MLPSASLRPVAGTFEVTNFRTYLRSRFGDLEAAFKALDLQSRGYLTVDELASGMKSLECAGHQPASLFHALDRDCTGIISMSIFINALDRIGAADETSSLHSCSTSAFRPSVPQSSATLSMDEAVSRDAVKTQIDAVPLLRRAWGSDVSKYGSRGTPSSHNLAEVVDASPSGVANTEVLPCGGSLCAESGCVKTTVQERLSRIEERLTTERALRLEAEQRLFQRVADLVGTVVLAKLEELGIVGPPAEGRSSKEALQADWRGFNAQLFEIRDCFRKLTMRLEESQERMDVLERIVQQRFVDLLEYQHQVVSPHGDRPAECQELVDTGRTAVLDCASGVATWTSRPLTSLDSKKLLGPEEAPPSALACLGAALVANELARGVRSHSVGSRSTERSV